MKIEAKKTYKVTKYLVDGCTSDIGELDGTDVKSLLKGYSYDETYGMWFSKAAKIGYDVEEQ